MATLPNETLDQASFAFKVIPSDTINIPQPYIVASGNNTLTAPNALVDNTAQFQGVGTSVPAVSVGDTVYNETTGEIASVTEVNSDSTITLSANIFLATPQVYTIYQPNPDPNSFLLYVGTGGDVEIVTSSPIPVLMKNVGDASFIPINVGRVNASNTTASDIIALL
tara:strand:+ start:13684 stop:14184 length:501 start_codon:yes stop_codon:yes gene_type:complete